MKRISLILMLALVLGTTLPARAADSPVGRWNTIDEKTGQARSHVEIYEQGGKYFGKITSIPQPNDSQGNPKTCDKCTGADKDKPIVGLMILRDLVPQGDRYKDGTVLDPDDGKIYKAEIWVADGKLKVRGYMGMFYRTQTWLKAASQ
jgi:uncharacterized protein (DUF2147 family)